MEDSGLPAMASAALAELRKTARLEGAAIIDMARPDSASVLLFDAAPGVPDAIGSAHQMLRRCPDAPSFSVGSDKRPILAMPWILHPDRRGGLVLWRQAGAPGWDERDSDFAASVAGLIRLILEQGPGEASIDRLTDLAEPFLLSGRGEPSYRSAGTGWHFGHDAADRSGRVAPGQRQPWPRHGRRSADPNREPPARDRAAGGYGRPRRRRRIRGVARQHGPHDRGRAGGASFGAAPGAARDGRR